MKIFKSLDALDGNLIAAKKDLASLTKKLPELSKANTAEVLSEFERKIEVVGRSIDDAINTTREAKKLKRPFIEEMMSTQIAILEQLDSKGTKAYAYAITIYSKAVLDQYDETTRGFIKNALREYFANQGLTYEGWE